MIDQFIIALGIILITMIITWFFAVKLNNFGIVDAVWSLSFLLQGIIFFILSESLLERKILILACLGLWSFRLGFYLTKRISSHHPHEDTRYIKLREEYGDNYLFRFFLFFLMQGLSVSFLTLPFIFAFNSSKTELSNLEIFGAVLWIISVIGESISDHQLNTFKNNKENRGKPCDIGLWKYSRHPNYFFESMIWWSFFLIFIGASQAYWTIYAPLTILFLLLKVTGVPPSEEQALKSKGDAYRAYQARTSMFVPWFPKNQE